MRYTVEYQRRHNDYNRGVILWQMNDCWPVVSWSGVDYKGRWKAEQYMTRRFFAPTLITSEVREGQVSLYAVSDLPEEQDDLLEIRLYDAKGEIESHSIPFVLRNGNQKLREFACPRDTTHSFLAFRDQKEAAFKVQLFCLPKDFHFEKPDLNISVGETVDRYQITVTSDTLCKDVMIDFHGFDAVLSDNFFDLVPNEPYTVTIDKKQMHMEDIPLLKEKLIIKTLNEVLLTGEKE